MRFKLCLEPLLHLILYPYPNSAVDGALCLVGAGLLARDQQLVVERENGVVAFLMNCKSTLIMWFLKRGFKWLGAKKNVSHHFTVTPTHTFFFFFPLTVSSQHFTFEFRKQKVSKISCSLPKRCQKGWQTTRNCSTVRTQNINNNNNSDPSLLHPPPWHVLSHFHNHHHLDKPTSTAFTLTCSPVRIEFGVPTEFTLFFICCFIYHLFFITWMFYYFRTIVH